MASVLLIEDDETQRFIAAFAMKKAGHEVHEAPDGPHGITAARKLGPDVIVCDVMMPGMTGYEVVAALRADANLRSIPVILLTAMTDRQHMRQGMTAGADDYLTKPYRPEELCEAIAAVLQRRHVQEEAFRNSYSGMVETALEQQKEALGRQYESKLQREIAARWSQASAATDLHYDDAFVLLADLLGSGAAGETGLAERVKQAQQSARDTLYVFGATQVLPYGTKLMAVFDAEQGSRTTPAKLRVARAAIALSKAAARDRPVSVAIHQGPVAMVSLSDGMHGDQGHALVPGETVNTVDALEEFASASGWRVAASEAMAGLMHAQVITGRTGKTTRGQLAIEITGVASE